MLDIDTLCAPVSADQPAGEDAEYSGVTALQELAKGTPGTLDPRTHQYVGTEEPDWRKVRDAALKLWQRTRDLRVAVVLTRAELALEGLPGLGRGLALVQRLLADFWGPLYPPLDAEENNNPIARLNTLADLADPEGLLSKLRHTPVVESRLAGRFTVRDLDLATGRLAPPKDEEPPKLELIEAAWASGDPKDNAARREGVAQGCEALQGIEQHMREHAGQAPQVDALKTMLRRLHEFYAAQGGGDAGTAQEPAAAQDLPAPAAQGTPAAPAARAGALSTRADAVRMLQQVSEFVRQTEPSSPAPMFIDRAVRVMQMSFADIVKELMPDSKQHIELLGGISLDPPAEDEDDH